MKKIYIVLLLFIPLISSQVKGDAKSNLIQDLVLIYQGGTHRLDWVKSELQPYVYCSEQNSWLFDGFLFIEFIDNKGHEYAQGYTGSPAGRFQWEWLLSRNFEKGKAIPALDNLLDSLSKQGLTPVRKHQIVLTLPEPIINFKSWGGLIGRFLDFSKSEDRILACTWYVDKAIETYKSQNFKNIELSGFYWVAEYSSESLDILPRIAQYVKSKGYKFYWIPYWGAGGAGDWQKSGFSVAYQQPNHFFATNIPDSRLDEACNFAKNHNMGLEMEFDERITETAFNKRFYAYLNYFEKNSVWKNSPVAYYQGNRAILDASKSTVPMVKNVYLDLSKKIIARQKYQDGLIVNTGIFSKEDENIKISLYPNPVVNELKVDSEKDVKIIEIYSIFGVKLQTSIGVNLINIGALNNGIYIVKIIFADGSEGVQKIYKQ